MIDRAYKSKTKYYIFLVLAIISLVYKFAGGEVGVKSDVMDYIIGYCVPMISLCVSLWGLAAYHSSIKRLPVYLQPDVTAPAVLAA